MATMRQREIISRLLDTYKNLTYLWQRDHIDYKNRPRREKGFNILLKIYKEYDECANLKVLKKKIENMRTMYYRELKKVLSAKQKGGQKYTPTLWYYDGLNFLGPPPENSLKSEEDIDDSSSDEEENPLRIDIPPSAVPSITTHQQTIKEKKETQPQIEENSFIPEIVAQKTQTPQKPQEEDWEVYIRCIGSQIRYLNKKQLIIAQKLISDVIFYGRLGQLSENSHIVTLPSLEGEPRSIKFNSIRELSSPPSNYSSPSPSQPSPRHFNIVTSQSPDHQSDLSDYSSPSQNEAKKRKIQ